MMMLRVENKMRGLGSSLVGSWFTYHEWKYKVVRINLKTHEAFIRRSDQVEEVSINMSNWTMFPGRISRLTKEISWVIT